MKYVILPIKDASAIFTDKELSTMRKSVDNTEVLMHEEKLIEKRIILGIETLSADNDVELPYPIYEYNTDEFNNLLNSEKWSEKK